MLSTTNCNIPFNNLFNFNRTLYFVVRKPVFLFTMITSLDEDSHNGNGLYYKTQGLPFRLDLPTNALMASHSSGYTEVNCQNVSSDEEPYNRPHLSSYLQYQGSVD
jgi:hypothetical protein